MRAAACAAAALLAACGSPQPMSDWERQNRDQLATPQQDARITPPAYPRPEKLIEFYLSPTATLRYYVDPASLSAMWKEGEVRYTMVSRSPSGVENVTYEALKCSGLHRVLATGNADRTWSVRSGEWRSVPIRADMSPPSMLKRWYFCPHNDPIQSAAEGVDALRNGGHPMVNVKENYDRR